MDRSTLILVGLVLLVLGTRKRAPTGGGSLGGGSSLQPGGSPGGASVSPSMGASSGSSTGRSSGSTAMGQGSTSMGSSPSTGQGSASTGSVGDQVGSSDTDILARTIYGEARGESDAAKQGVASVVLNRLAQPLSFYGALSGIAGVCKQPYQFSCWNAGDPNLPVIQSVDASNAVFADCLSIASDAVNGALADNTGGATFYHDTSIATPRTWGAVVQTVQIGRLVFFRSAGGLYA